MNKLLTYFILFIAFFFVVEASHFRFGTISWQPVTTYNNIKFSSNFAYRITFYQDKSKIYIGQEITVGTLKYGFKVGSSDQSQSVKVKVTSINLDDDWFTGEYSVTKTYPVAPTPTTSVLYTAIFTDCCRIGGLINNGGGDWNITTSILVKPDQDADESKWNHSPVSGMVPIYTLNYDKINTFLITASDANADLLEYSLSTVYAMSQPSGLTINKTTGIATFTPTQKGLYSTQIYIKDTNQAYIVVDFLLNSVVENGVCHTSCTKPGIACTGNSVCKGCTGSDSTGNTCTSKPPMFVYPAAENDVIIFPTNGYPIMATPDEKREFGLKCTQGETGKLVTIQPANVPSGSNLIVNQQNGVDATLRWSWTPTVAQIGSYVVSATCFDNKGLTSTVTSFTITVQKPFCGNGVAVTPTTCKCNDGWDPSSNCYECLPGNFGANCTKAEDCKNGALNGGTQGDGVCTCYYGWTGLNCNNTVSQICNDDRENVLLTYTDTEPSYFNPTFTQIYLNTDQSKAALTMPTKLAIPYPLNSLDILVVMDAQPSTDAIWNSVSTYMGDFITKINAGLCEKTDFALGFFSDASVGYPFQLSRVSGDNINILKSLKPDAVSSSSTKNSAEALLAAANYPSGWDKGTLKIIVLLTDNDHSASVGTITNMTNSLIEQSVLPIVIGMNTDLPKWNATFTAAGFGAARKAIASTTNIDWINVAFAGIKDVLNKAVVKVLSDPNGFATIPAPIALNINSNANTQVDVPVKIKYPASGTSETFPSILYSVIGFGTTKVIINYNHAPTATNGFINTRQNVASDFYLSGADMDANTLSVVFKSIPATSVGTITSGSTTVKVGDSFPISTKFTFTPTLNYNGAASTFTFITNDGCLDSPVATVSITVTFVNQAPTCTTLTAPIQAVAIGTAKSFVLAGSDIEASSSLSLKFVDISAIASLGTITSGSTTVTTSTSITLVSGSATLSFKQTANVAVDKTVTVTYKANDGSLDSVSTCTATINLKHFNVAPTASAQTPLTVQQAGTLNFTLTGSDSDSPSVVFNIKNLAPGAGGKFYKCLDTTKTAITTDYSVDTFPLVAGKATFINDLCYIAPTVNGSPYASLQYTVTDDEGLVSPLFKVEVNVNGARNNAKPVVTKIPDFSMNEDATSTVKQITGTDSDQPTFDNTLQAIILVNPTNGKLTTTPTGTLSAPVSSVAPYSLYYTPNPLFFGTDSFTYTVEDSMGARADQSATTLITVNHVNHAPVLVIPPYSLTSKTVGDKLKLTPTDVDVQNTVFTCTITSKPTKAIINQADGSAITSFPSALSSTNQYNFSVSSTIYNDFTDSFTATCSDSDGGVSAVATGTINYKYINIAPIAYNQQIELDQDTLGTPFTFNAIDTESQSTLLVKIVVLPINGKLQDKSGNTVTISTANVLYKLDDLKYIPNQGWSDYDQPNHVGPADSFDFVAQDAADDTSNKATVSCKINPRNPPTYNGVRVLYTKENTDLPFNIQGTVGGGGNFAYLNIISVVSRGSLYQTHCMGTEGCKPAASPLVVPFISKSDSNTHTFSFTPVEYDNGQYYANITFTLFDVFGSNEYHSGEYTINIHVSPVNQVPEVILINYQLVNGTGLSEVVPFTTNILNMPVNHAAIIKYDGTDIDNTKPELTSFVYYPPIRGSLYVYNAAASDFLGAKITSTNSAVPISADGFWYVVYVPPTGFSGDGYARIPISIKDKEGGLSEPSTVLVNVVVKNVAPIITIGKANFTTIENTTVAITDVSFDDPDSSRYTNINIVISLVGLEDETPIPTANATMTLSVTSRANCIISTTVNLYNCTANKDILNTTIKTISVSHQTAGSYRVKIWVDDLGYNAPLSVRASSHLTDVDFVTVRVNAPEVTTKENNNKTVLTAAIAGAAGGAAIIAGAIWGLLKKKAPPTDAFFGDAPFTDGAVTSNPMYQQSQSSAINPLYEGGTD